MGNYNLSSDLTVLIKKEERVANWLSINKTKYNQTNKK